MSDGYEETMEHVGVALVAVGNARRTCPSHREKIRLEGAYSRLKRVHDRLLFDAPEAES